MTLISLTLFFIYETKISCLRENKIFSIKNFIDHNIDIK